MAIALNQVGQVALSVDDIDAAEQFYERILGLRKLYRFGDLVFFDCAGLRLLVEKSNVQPLPGNSPIYFRVADIALVYARLRAQGVGFVDTPHLIAPMEDHDLWMVFFRDPAGNLLALMQEAPKGYLPSVA